MAGFVETIRRVGLFLVVAQMIVHLSPEKRYEKYIRLIAGVIVLTMLIGPLREAPEDLWLQIQREMDADTGRRLASLTEGGASGWNGESLPNRYEETLSNEIKSKINNIVSKQGYQIEEVSWKEEGEAYLCVIVRKEEQECGTGSADAIGIEPVRVELGGEKPQTESSDESEEAAQLGKEIGDALGMEENSVKVVIWQ